MLAHLWYQPIGLLLFFIAANSSTDRPSLRGSGCYSVSQSSLTLRPHGLQHTRSPCPSASPRVCPNSCPLSQRCQKTISSCYPPLLPSIFPSMRVFSDKSALFIKWQSIGVSASASVLPMNIRGWFPLGLTCLISLLSKGLSRVFSSTTVWKHQFLSVQPSLWSSTHIRTLLLVKLYLWLYADLSAKWCLCSLVCCLGLS